MSDLRTPEVRTGPSADRPVDVADVLAGAEAALERTTWDGATLRAWQERRLRALLATAVDRSPFHRERLGGLDPAAVGLEDLSDLPMMTKPEMMARFDDVVTDRRLTRALVDAHVAAAPEELDLLLGRYVVMASGGSSGTRGTFVFDPAALTEFVLSLLRGTLATLSALGIGPDAPVAGALVAARSTVHGTGATSALAGGQGSPVTMHRISATEPLAVIVERLNVIQPLLLVGYSSVLLHLAAEKEAGRLAIAPLAVGSTSEALSAEARATVEGAFGVPMTDTFGSSEGLCGVSPPGERPIVFATDSCLVELVDEDLAPVAPGTVAAKALITNLANHTQPLIRYELTDRFVEVPGPHPDGRLRAHVDGRHDDPLRYPDGAVVHPLALREVLTAAPEVREHQVRQTTDGIDVSVVSSDSLDVASLTEGLADALRRAGSAEPCVTVERVEAIPRDPLTGKPRRVVPLP